MRNEIERLFIEDIREKKKAASGSFHKKGKGVKHHMSGIKTPYDFMTNKQKKTLNGKVTTYSMYDTLLSKNDFDSLPEEKQKEYMLKWRELYSNEKIMKSLEIKSPGKFQYLLDKLEIPKKQYRKSPPRQGVKKDIEEVHHLYQEKMTVAVIPEKTDIVILNGLNINYYGIYDSEQLSKIFTKLQLLIEGEENSFNLSITIQERP